MNASLPQTLQLRDIHLPAPPDSWPPAPGWWVAAAIILALLAWFAVIARRRYREWRQRRHILGLLQQLEESAGETLTPEYLAQLSCLLKRIALQRFPATAVAALSGRNWLRFLDESGGDGRFCNGPGRVLAAGPYVRELPDSRDTRALAPLVREWINKNTGARDA